MHRRQQPRQANEIVLFKFHLLVEIIKYRRFSNNGMLKAKRLNDALKANSALIQFVTSNSEIITSEIESIHFPHSDIRMHWKIR